MPRKLAILQSAAPNKRDIRETLHEGLEGKLE